ncbi:hypothetical protein BD309DRAFT_664880 [Dichomitus squalens]|nr:hypothetical protein BD309DRAFT_664880 [Dichomitus squalens]
MPSLRRLEIVLGDWEGQDPPPGFQQPSRAEQSFREVEKALMDGPLAGGVEHVTFVVPRKSTAGTPSFWAVRLRETFPRLEEKVLLKIWTDPDTLISTNCHVKHVEALTFSNTGQHLATMALDDVALWDVKTNTAVARFMRNADGSPGSSTGQEIAFSPNASRLAVVAGYKHITLQDVSSADSADVLELPWREIGTVVCCQWSLDGTKLAVGVSYASGRMPGRSAIGLSCVLQVPEGSCPSFLSLPTTAYLSWSTNPSKIRVGVSGRLLQAI